MACKPCLHYCCVCKSELQAAVLECCSHSSLEILGRVDVFFLYVLEHHAASRSCLIQPSLAGLRKGYQTLLGVGREALGCCSEVKQKLLLDPGSEKDGREPAHSQDSLLLDCFHQLCAFEELLWGIGQSLLPMFPQLIISFLSQHVKAD